MAMQHTPGPWRLDTPGCNRHLSATYHQIDAGHGYLDETTGTGFWVNGFMNAADARLIAAAPDMLTSLRAMLALYDFDDELPADHPVVTARAAIAKAESP